MIPAGFVSSSLLEHALRHVESAGSSAEGIVPMRYRRTNSRGFVAPEFLPTNVFLDCLAQVGNVVSSPALMIEISRAIHASLSGSHLEFAAGAHTVADWYDRLPALQFFLGDLGVLAWQSEDHLSLCWVGPDPNHVAENLVACTALSIIARSLDFICQEPPPIVSLDLVTPLPTRQRAMLERELRCNVISGANQNRLNYRIELLDAAVQQVTWSSHHGNIELSYGLHAQMHSTEPLVARVKAAILERLAVDGASVQSVSQTLAMSERTLQRRLSDLELPFRSLRLEIQQTRAKRYLVNTDLTIAQIAASSGFKQQSAFSAAFKEWSGMAPGDYRKAYSVMFRGE